MFDARHVELCWKLSALRANLSGEAVRGVGRSLFEEDSNLDACGG